MADVNNAVPFTNPRPESGTFGSKTDPYLTEDRHGRLDNLPSDRLPQQVTQDIFTKAKDQSILMSLGQQIPVSINENVIYREDAFPEAGQVGGGTSLAEREAATKPVSGYRFGDRRTFSPIKLAVIVTMSEEFARANVDRLYSDLASKLSGAIARAADLAVFHGRDALTGGMLNGISENGYITETANSIPLDYSSAADPDLVGQFINGYNLVVDDDEKNYDFTSFAAHPTLRSRLVQARDTDGNPVFQGGFPGSGSQISLNNQPGSLFGIPVNWGRIVGGKVGQAPATNVKMIGGDWSQLAYGWADQIRIKVSDSATLMNGTTPVSLWQTNQIAVLAEATFGWYVADPDAFVAYTEGTVPGEGEGGTGA